MTARVRASVHVIVAPMTRNWLSICHLSGGYGFDPDPSHTNDLSLVMVATVLVQCD